MYVVMIVAVMFFIIGIMASEYFRIAYQEVLNTLKEMES
ncbi:hypothetical protein CLV38_11915 [Alkalibacterium olivapovliticus]|uniref:Uncharacterized protein n=1 Tax=Alkalibacterium olivapovliticus TaxID=99907 RepID=A0A2T0W5H1_9LACT|nr:hypothetical protein CLV38_11915 [Alkalibacterium olivapovliticus]